MKQITLPIMELIGAGYSLLPTQTQGKFRVKKLTPDEKLELKKKKERRKLIKARRKQKHRK